MKSFLILLLFLGFMMPGNAQIFEWANTFNGGGKSSVYQTLVNSNGDIYVAGHFSGDTDFDPGDGTLILTSYGDVDAYVAKLDANGNIIWAKQFGGVEADYIRGMDIDAAGNIYCTGSFSGIADFDPGSESVYYTSYGGEDMFIVELDEDGNYLWSGQMGGAQNNHSVNIKTTSSGNIYISGYYMGVIDINPADTAEFYLTTNIQATFVEKLNANHELLWAKSMGGAAFDYCQAMCLDENENIYTTGMFGGIGDFDPGDGEFYLYAVGDRDIFMSKLNSDGEYVWAISMGGLEAESAQSIAYDGNENIYVCGNFKGTVDFDPDTTNYYMTSNGDYDIFIGKLNVAGELQWMKQIGSVDSDSPYAMSIDNQNNVYTTGLFMNSVDFDPGTEVFYLTSFGDYDAYINKLDSEGDFVWAANVGGSELDRGLSIFNSGANELFVGGLFTGTADFDPGNESYYLTASGEYNSFLLKLNTQLSGLENYNSSNISIYPNPSSGYITVRLGQNISNANIFVFDIMGRIVKKQSINNRINTILDFSEIPGLYFVKISTNEGVEKTIKVIIN